VSEPIIRFKEQVRYEKPAPRKESTTATPPRPKAGEEPERPDPEVFALAVKKWMATPKVETPRGWIDRSLIPKQIHTGRDCPKCKQPKFVLNHGNPFCYGCGYRPDLHAPGGTMPWTTFSLRSTP